MLSNSYAKNLASLSQSRNYVIIRGSSHYTNQIERLLSKLLSKGEERSPLKYIMRVIFLDFEYLIQKRIGLSTRVWVSILEGHKLLLREQNLGTKSAKKCYHAGTLEVFHLWSLATSVKA